MVPVFRLLAGAFGSDTGWWLGMAVYWLVWGGIFPLLIIGQESIRELIRPRKPDRTASLLVILSLVFASAYRLVPGMVSEEPNVWATVAMAASALANGFFEEVLWRGVYMKLFPASILWRIIWPSVWFGIWHYAPVSISPDSGVVGFMIGSTMFGFLLSYVAWKTDTVWWPLVIHTLGGIIMAV
jgi:membrane protease YdiL (CAAX protease family)